MLVLVTYDVNTETPEGKKRLRQVAKICEKYGQRVQNSVFECLIDEAKFYELKKRLSAIINKENDSLRYYRLGNKFETKVETDGKQYSVDIKDILFL